MLLSFVLIHTMQKMNTTITLPLVSVIIPVYNGGTLINDAIDSVVNQTYGNWELIIVDDGSSDNSFAICSERAAEDSRITVLHQENGGVNAARANGVDSSNGEYLVFLDADDSLPYDALERGLSYMSNDVKVVAEGKGDYELTNEEYSLELLKGTLPPGICEKMYSADLYKKVDYHLDRRIVMGEDLLINLILCLNDFKVRVVSDPIYFVNSGNPQSVTKQFRRTWEYEKFYFQCVYDRFVDKSRCFSNYDRIVYLVNKSRLNGIKYMMLAGNRLDYSDPDFLALKDFFNGADHEIGLSESLIFSLRNAWLYRLVMKTYMRLAKLIRR